MDNRWSFSLSASVANYILIGEKLSQHACGRFPTDPKVTAKLTKNTCITSLA